MQVRWLNGYQERVKYMSEKEGQEYTLIRLKKINLLLDQFITRSVCIYSKRIEVVMNLTRHDKQVESRLSHHLM